MGRGARKRRRSSGQRPYADGRRKAGTKGGVASWSGKAIDGSALLGGYDGGALPNPYAADKPLYTITSSNAGEYDSVLTDGQKALLATYPDTYKMNVYKSRRSCTYPEYVYKAAKRNAVVGKNVDGGSGVSRRSCPLHSQSHQRL